MKISMRLRVRRLRKDRGGVDIVEDDATFVLKRAVFAKGKAAARWHRVADGGKAEELGGGGEEEVPSWRATVGGGAADCGTRRGRRRRRRDAMALAVCWGAGLQNINRLIRNVGSTYEDMGGGVLFSVLL